MYILISNINKNNNSFVTIFFPGIIVLIINDLQLIKQKLKKLDWVEFWSY